MRDGSNSICDPVCTPGCINGNCVEPNSCQCWEGYEDTRQHFLCAPTCRPACENGRCAAPGRCECDASYVVTNASEPHVCTSQCKETCINAECLSPDVCTCLEGFAFLEGSSTECAPVCRQPCRFGQMCTAPDTCSAIGTISTMTVTEKTSMPAWGVLALSLLLCVVLLTLPVVFMRYILHRRKAQRDKQQANLIENPSYGVCLASSEDITGEQQIRLDD